MLDASPFRKALIQMSHPLHHIHLIATVHALHPIDDVDTFNIWMQELIDLVDMQTFIAPVTKRCDEPPFNIGCSSHAMLTTSHCSAHSFLKADGSGVINFDLYSCKCFDVEKVLAHFEIMAPTSINYMVIDRNDGNIVIENTKREFLGKSVNHAYECVDPAALK